VWADLAVGVDESVGEAAGRGVDDRPERFRSGEGWVGEEQVGEGEIERGVGELARGPVEHDVVVGDGEDVERVQVAVTDDQLS